MEKNRTESTIEMMKPLQELTNLQTELWYTEQYVKELESKIIQWYQITRDEEFRAFIGIDIKREGKTEQL